MRMWLTKFALALLLALLMVVGVSIPIAAQEEGDDRFDLRLLSPYLGVSVEPGDTASFDIQVVASEGEVVDLEVVDLPDEWRAEIRGGGFVVDRVLFDEELRHDLELRVDVPPTVTEGTYGVSVAATGESSSDRLDFVLIVAERVGGGVSLNAEFPALRGPSDVEFSFTLELENDTGEEVQFGLQAQGPAGWQIEARPAGQSRASSVTVADGSSERITVQVDPPDSTQAGTYDLVVRAAGGGETVSAELLVEITGNFAMTLITPDERLNFDVQAGQETELPLVVVNTGTGPLADVSLSATPPGGWEVSFSPESISRIEPGGSAEVTAVVTPSSDAITGDYRITMNARVPETSDSIEMRATVETSALWGLVGVLVILLALAALAVVFRRFGRR